MKMSTKAKDCPFLLLCLRPLEREKGERIFEFRIVVLMAYPASLVREPLHLLARKESIIQSSIREILDITLH